MPCPGPLGTCSAVCPLDALLCVCGVLGHSAPVHRCARWVRCFACAVSPATWLLFTGVPAWFVVWRVLCPGPLGSCSPVCPLGVLFCLCGVPGHLAPVHRCAPVVCCVTCAVSWDTWLLFTSVPARCFVLLVRCPGPLGSCSRCARVVCCVVCAVSWATWLLFTGLPARCIAPVCGVLGHLAPVHRCAPVICCVTCAVSWVTWLSFTVVPARCVVLLVRCPGPIGSGLPVCPRGLLCCVCGVLGHLASVHRCARSVRCPCVRCPGPLGSCSPVCPLGALPVCAVSWATWLLFTSVPAWCVFLLKPCPRPLGSWSPV